MANVVERLPLFPLGLVCLPSEVIPLHIFEERYRTMVERCLEQDLPFGILWADGDEPHEVGCTANITRVLERMDDGRLNILAQGASPFRLLRRIEDLPYPAGDVELLADEDGEVDAAAGSAARERYAALLERATDSRPEEGDLEELSSYEMAAAVDFGTEAKQSLLELRSESERLRSLSELFATAAKRIEYTELTGERARSNGHVRR